MGNFKLGRVTSNDLMATMLKSDKNMAASVKGVFSRFKIKKRSDKTIKIRWPTKSMIYVLSIHETQKYNYHSLGKHCLRVDGYKKGNLYCGVNETERVFTVEPSELISKLKEIKSNLEYIRKKHVLLCSAWDAGDFDLIQKIKLDLFVNTIF